MMDNDFPVSFPNVASAGQGGSPYEPIDPAMLQRMQMPGTVPAGGFKEFLKQYLPKVPGTGKPTGYVREELEGSRSYSQTGTDVPDFSVGQQYQQREGGPIMDSMVASGSPSFDLKMPKIPGGQSAEGIPNASPEMLRRWVERKTKNPGGQELPGFLKGA